jgi:hypothetical protein
MDVLQRRRLGVTNFFHTDVWACGAYCRDRRPETSTREVHICDASAEVAGVEVASELMAMGLINLCGCLRGVCPPDNHDAYRYAIGRDEFLCARGETLIRKTGVFCNWALGSDFLVC